ncbi:class I SAM-dependent methyltransferase [Verrucomicrobiales bacterium]|nr:class I SAM-dependent methyltransferase [Verrucomicrobiales bacterium]
MLDDPKCDICGQFQWETIGRRTYTKDGASNDYEEKRFFVLFEVWLPGKQEISLSSLVCRNCGFVCYSPRPEVKDIDAKYRVIREMGSDYGKKESTLIEDRRAVDCVRKIRKYLRPGSKILDFGGGDGRLLVPLAGEGHEVFLVDYNVSPRAGVTKVSDTLPLRKEFRNAFRVIVANQVIEHVAKPTEVINELTEYLEEDGVILIEVPMEIWQDPPLQAEPVTHINFFTACSLRSCLQAAGLSVISSKYVSHLNSNGVHSLGVRSVGRKRSSSCGGKIDQGKKGYSEVKGLISPSLITRFRKCWWMRVNLRKSLVYKLSKIFRRV